MCHYSRCAQVHGGLSQLDLVCLCLCRKELLTRQQAAAAFTAYTRSNPPTSYSETLYSLVSFSERFATAAFPRRKDGRRLQEEKLSKKDMELLIRWLSRDCGVIVAEGDVSVVVLCLHCFLLALPRETLTTRWSRSWPRERGRAIIPSPRRTGAPSRFVRR